MAWADRLPACPAFYPSKEEFEDPITYIRSIAPLAAKYGICKIKCPLNASTTSAEVLMKENSSFKFTTRVQPMRLAKWDTKDRISFTMSGRQYSYNHYEAMANKFFKKRFSSMGSLPPNFIEAEFWHEMSSKQILKIEYGSDIDGSAFSSSNNDPLGRSKWNLQKISSLPKSLFRFLRHPIPGVTQPMLYLGMLFSVFAWHIEDHFLYSINYHHSGALKTWYGVPGQAALEFEKVAQEYVYDHTVTRGKNAAFNLLAGKTTMFPPKILIQKGIPVYRANQSPGEFVITFPQAYHAGFSHGFNCGEAVNFAIADWLPFGAFACQMYMSLSKTPLLPHEEILCMEAMHLARSNRNSEVKKMCRNSRNSDLDEAVTTAFTQFMKFQDKVRLQLKEQKAQVHISRKFVNSISCSICRHLSYANVITCPCHTGPICLNHEKEISKCHCGNACSIISRRNWSDLENIMLQFEGSTSDIEEASGEQSINGGCPTSSLLLEETTDNEDHDYFSSCFVPENTKMTEQSVDIIELQALSAAKEQFSLSFNDSKPFEACKTCHNVEKGARLFISTLDEESLHSTKNLLGDSASATKKKKHGMLLRSAVSDEEANTRPVCKNGEQNNSAGSEDGIQLIGKKFKDGLCQTVKGNYMILFDDIVQKLYFRKSQLEVLHYLKSKAEKVGVEIEAFEVESVTGQRHVAFSYKGCLLVKQLLSKGRALCFEQLLDKTFGRLQKTSLESNLDKSNEKDQCRFPQVKRSFSTSETSLDHENHHNPVKRRRSMDILKLKSQESSSLWQEHGHICGDAYLPYCGLDTVSDKRHLKVPTESILLSKMHPCCCSNEVHTCAFHSSPRSSEVQSSNITLGKKHGNTDNSRDSENSVQYSKLEVFVQSGNQFPVPPLTAIQVGDLMPGLENNLVSSAGSVGASVVGNGLLSRKWKMVAMTKVDAPELDECTGSDARTHVRRKASLRTDANAGILAKNKGTIVCEISLAETKMETESSNVRKKARVSFAEDPTTQNIGFVVSRSERSAEAHKNVLQGNNFDTQESGLQPESSERTPSTTVVGETADCLGSSKSSLSTIKASKILSATSKSIKPYENHKTGKARDSVPGRAMAF